MKTNMLSKLVSIALILIGICVSLNPTQSLAQCTVDPKAVNPGVYPKQLIDGTIDVAYDPASITMVFRKDTLIKVDTTVFAQSIKFDLDVKFTGYTIDSSGGVPSGMEINLKSCNVPDCIYEIEKNDKGCVQITGTPTESGDFKPFARAILDGSFVMPKLGLPIPGLPPAGTVIILSKAPDMLKSFIEPLRKINFTTNLKIQGGKPSEPCVTDVSATSEGLNPNPMKDGVRNQLYPTTPLTMVFAEKATGTIDTSILTFKLKADFEINYETLKIDSSYDVPPGMTMELSTCNTTDCIYDLSKDKKGCVQIGGTPTKNGSYYPTLRAKAQKAYFLMPDFGLPINPPGLPAKGSKVDLLNPPALLKRFVDKYKILTLSTELNIYTDTTNQNFCTPDPAPKYMGLYPTRMNDGKINIDYGRSTMTMVFQTDTLIKLDTTVMSFPIKADFDVTFTEYVVDTAMGLPDGMTLDLSTCNRIECSYRMPKQKRGCLEVYGTPTQSGVFRPTVRAVADGFFMMPDLGPIAKIIPGLPPVGSKVVLSEANGPISMFLDQMRRRQIRSELHILPDKYTDLCEPVVPINKGFMTPENLPDGDKDVAYANTELIMDFPNNLDLDLGPGGNFKINFTAFTIDSVGGVPSGMKFDGYCKSGNNCQYTLNEIDTALNRVCFQISGTPLQGGIYNPRIITTADGWVSSRFGQNFRLGQLPGQLPPNVRRGLDSVRTYRFSTELRINPVGTGIGENSFLNNKITYYPNPAGDWINLSIIPSDKKELTNKLILEVFDIRGQKIETQKITQSETHISTSHFPDGHYVFKLSDENGNFSIRKIGVLR